MRALVDAGVLIQVLSPDHNRRSVATTLMDERPYVTTTTLHLVTQALLDKTDLSPLDVLEFVKVLRLKAEILREPPSVLESSLTIVKETGLSLNSAHIVAAAMHCGCKRVFSVTGAPPLKVALVTVTDPFFAP